MMRFQRFITRPNVQPVASKLAQKRQQQAKQQIQVMNASRNATVRHMSSNMRTDGGLDRYEEEGYDRRWMRSEEKRRLANVLKHSMIELEIKTVLSEEEAFLDDRIINKLTKRLYNRKC